MSIPEARVFFRPNRSPALPATGRNPASISEYMFTTHCRTELFAEKSRAIDGSAVLTTVPSRKITKVVNERTASATYFLNDALPARPDPDPKPGRDIEVDSTGEEGISSTPLGRRAAA